MIYLFYIFWDRRINVISQKMKSGVIKSISADLCVRRVCVQKVCRHGASTADQPGRRGGSGRLIAAQLYATSTSLFKSDH